MRYCAACDTEKSLEEFDRNKRKKFGRSYTCKACIRDKRRTWLLKTRYGLTVEEYERMVTAQEARCAICLRDTKLVIDHCHSTGRVRGLLCSPCNRHLGVIQDDVAAVERMLRYLKGPVT